MEAAAAAAAAAVERRQWAQAAAALAPREAEGAPGEGGAERPGFS